jgi:hypothetical protein
MTEVLMDDVTREQQRAALDSWMAFSEELGGDEKPMLDAFDTAKAELGLDVARICCLAIPTIVIGEVDGISFLGRERRAEWRVEVVRRPGADLYMDSHDDVEVIAEGEGWRDPAEMLREAVKAVKALNNA